MASSAHDKQLCKRCGELVAREGIPSALAIKREGTTSATLDHVIGADAAVKWDSFHERKEERDQIRKELGTAALTQTADGSYAAATPELIEKRKKAYKSLNA